MSTLRNTMSREKDLAIPATMAAVDMAQRYASAFCQSRAIDSHHERVLLLILEELVTNTVTHGRTAEGSEIDVGLSSDGHHIVLCYQDRGVAFDPLRDNEPLDLTQSTRSRAVGGVGWPLIFHYCSDVRYARIGETNRLQLKVPIVELLSA